MYTLRINAIDPLYHQVNQYLAQYLPHSVVLISRSDYRDPACVKVGLEYGKYTINIPSDPNASSSPKKPGSGDTSSESTKLDIEHVAAVVDQNLDARIVITSPSFESNMRLVNLALSHSSRTLGGLIQGEGGSSTTIAPVYAWENSGWHHKQAVWVNLNIDLVESQQQVYSHVKTFYSKESRDLFDEYTLPYQKGLLLSGPSCSGKHHLIRRLAYDFKKSIAHLPITELSYPYIGPAIACCPLNSIILIENLAQFYTHIPSPERCLFLRHLETAFNTSVKDPQGLLIIILLPTTIPQDLENFLKMPQRFPLKIKMSLASKTSAKTIFHEYFDNNCELIEEFANKTAESNLPDSTLKAFLFNKLYEKQVDGEEKVKLAIEDVVEDLQKLLDNNREERMAIDLAGIEPSNRLYS